MFIGYLFLNFCLLLTLFHFEVHSDIFSGALEQGIKVAATALM